MKRNLKTASIALFLALSCPAFGQSGFTDRVADMWKAGNYAEVMEIARQRLANNPDDMPGLLLKLEYEIEYLRLDSVSNTAACILQVAPRIQTPRFSEFRDLVMLDAEFAMRGAADYPPEQYAIDIQKVGTITNKILGSAFALQALEDDGLFNPNCPETRQTEQPSLVPAPAEVPAFAAPDFDDSSWQTTILPPADDARPWPDGFNGVVWYRRTFELAADMPTRFDKGFVTLGESGEGLRVFVNGQLARSRRSTRGIWYHRPRPLIFRHGTNHIAIEAPIENGQGGIPGQPPDHVRLWIAQAMHIVYADNHPCDSRVTGQWLFPLSGPWKYILIPSPATP